MPAHQTTALLFETLRTDAENKASYLFLRPSRILTTRRLAEVSRIFKQGEAALKAGKYLAGFVSYEAGYALEPIGKVPAVFPFPLLWFGVFEEPQPAGAMHSFLRKQRGGVFEREEGKYSLDYPDYRRRFQRIQNYIRRGETYQVNFTFKYQFPFRGDAFAFYEALKREQKVSYASFLQSPDFSVLSLSPELFFRKKGLHVAAKPMKGTAARGLSRIEDAALRRHLKSDSKTRAENLMIVDLLRNDLGRTAQAGSVCTSQMFQVERYETLYQMTSTLYAQLRRDIPFFDFFKTVFPSGSVTGAPKIRTMQIIHELEKEPRGIYTGAIGFVSPKGKAVFNVGIRTVWIENGRGEVGIGSGIVADSKPDREYQESRLKAQFLLQAVPPFELVETMLFRDGKCVLWQHHLRRLLRSARHFHFEYDRKKILREYERLRKKLSLQKSFRVRFLLSRGGKTYWEVLPLSPLPEKVSIALAQERTVSTSPYYRHKTTFRPVYKKGYAAATKRGYFDLLFQNEKDELTEGAISNVYVEKSGKFWTPPLAAGVLGGVYRNHLLKTDRRFQEKKLTFKDLWQADGVYLSNAVRGFFPVHVKKVFI